MCCMVGHVAQSSGEHQAAGLFVRAAEGSSGYAPNGMFYCGLSLY